MSDEHTRGVGFDGPSPKTRVADLKIQVRFASGKIYGPYQRAEITAFIFAGRLKGEEEILVEGESNWRLITSDVEFFDAFQDLLTGKRSRDKKKKKRTDPVLSTKIGQAPLDLGDEKTRALSETPRAPLSDLFAPDTEPSAPLPQSHISEAAASGNLNALPGGSPPKKIVAKSKPKVLLGGLLGLLVLAYLSTSLPRGTNEGDRQFNARSVFKPIGALEYGRALSGWWGDFSFKVPAFPVTLNGADALLLPDGFGADFWIKDIRALVNEGNADQKSTVSYWMRWAWNLQWAGECVRTFDIQNGERMAQQGREIQKKLIAGKLLTPAYQSLFESLPFLFAGKWTEAETTLKKTTEIPIAQWLAELASWMGFWSRGGNGDIYQSPAYATYRAPLFDLTAQLRRAFVTKDPRTPQLVSELAEAYPFNFELWFNASQFVWRLKSENIQIAQRTFLTGVASLALVPASFQKVYWAQFAEFLASFGQPILSEQARLNQQALSERDLSASRKQRTQWWDFGQEGLDINLVAQQAFDRLQKSKLQGLEIPTLLVLGAITKRGSEYLAEAAYHFAFQKEWIKALELFERAREIDNKNPQVLGGLIWAHTSLFQFDKAFRVYDDLKSISTITPEATKFMGVIEMQGREYDAAKNSFETYLKQTPNNGWGHYFYALLNQKIEKNVDCAKAANLARVHGVGELKFRAMMLFYRCRILSKLAVKDTLRELEDEIKRDPANIAILLEYIDAQANADNVDAALKFAQESVAHYPRAYDLRLKLAEMYERKGKFDLALAFYNDAKKDKPESSEASVRVAKIFESQEKYLQAAQNYETAARIDSNYPDIWISAARMYEKAGHFSEAAQMYVREIEERPAVLQSFIEAAEFMLKINAPQEVPKIFQKFSSDFHGDPRVLTRLAQAYLALKDIENARQTASLALASDPKIPEANRVLGIVYDQLGQFEEAKRYFKNYLTLLPQAVDAVTIQTKISNPPYPTN